MFDRVEPLHLSINLLIVCAHVCMSVPPQETRGMNEGHQSWWPYPPQGAILLVFHCRLYTYRGDHGDHGLSQNSFVLVSASLINTFLRCQATPTQELIANAESSGVLSLSSNFLPSVLGTECRN